MGSSAFLAGCATQGSFLGHSRLPTLPVGFPSSPSQQKFDWSVGQAWEYRVVNLFSQEVVARPRFQIVQIQPGRISLDASNLESSSGSAGLRGQEFLTDDGQLLGECTFDGSIEFENSVPFLGLTNDSIVRTRYRYFGDSTWRLWEERTQLLGFEKIKLPAGEFECGVFERNIRFASTDLFRINSQRREKIWWAPKAKRWVKREWSGRYFDPGDFDPGARFISPRIENWRLWELVAIDGQATAR